MSKHVLEAMERLTHELTQDEQAQLADELNRRTRKARWNRLFTAIDARVRRYGTPSEEEIIRLCREVRRERAASRRRS